MFYELRATLVKPNSAFDEVIGIAIGNDNARAIQESKDPQAYMAKLFKMYEGEELEQTGAYIKSCELREVHPKTRGIQ